MEHLGKGDLVDCPLCTFNLDLAQGQRVLEHIGAHILFDARVDRALDPCGPCLLPAAACRYFLKKGKGAKAGLKIDTDLSHGCILIKCKFSYRVAAKSSPSSPSSNIPLACPICPKAAPAVWRYNLKRHLRTVHPLVGPKGETYHDLYKLDPSESEGMKNIWVRREKQVVKRIKKSDSTPLVVSEAHRARINVSVNPSEPSDHEVDSNNDDDDEHEASNINRLEEQVDETLNVNSHSSELTDNINQTSTSTSQYPTVLRNEPDMALPDILPVNSVNSHEGPHRTTVETSSRSTRKRTAFSRQSFSKCMCGLVADPTSSEIANLDVIECQRAGCETRFYHIACINPTRGGKQWVCEVCSASR
ncbi:hypothetical protein BDN72DRAFT_962369, partial [Pluteus cervinus]